MQTKAALTNMLRMRMPTSNQYMGMQQPSGMPPNFQGMQRQFVR